MPFIEARDLIAEWERFRREQAPDLAAAVQAAFPALTLLGDYIGNGFAGKTGIPAFDLCALNYALNRALAVEDVPHMSVCWANAISTHGRVTECFGERDEALKAFSDGRRLWNNTRVDMYWHEPHGRARARRTRSDAHRKAVPVHVWGIDCAECIAIGQDRDASGAWVRSVADSLGYRDLPAVTS